MYVYIYVIVYIYTVNFCENKWSYTSVHSSKLRKDKYLSVTVLSAYYIVSLVNSVYILCYELAQTGYSMTLW